MIRLDRLFKDIESISMDSLTSSRDGELQDIKHYTTISLDGYIYDIVILAAYNQVVVNVTKLLYKDGRTVITLGNSLLSFSTGSTTLKQDIIVKLRSALGLQPVLNDSYEFEYRGEHFLIDTCKNNPQICVVFDADNDYKPVLSVSLESDDELAPGKEVPDCIIRLMY